MNFITTLINAVTGGASIWLKIGLIVAVLAAVGTIYGLWHHRVYQSGYQAAINEIAEKDRRAVDAANQADQARKACDDSGGTWDTSSGVCEPAPSR